MEKVARGANNFALRLHRLLCQDVSDENICVSPYSVFSSLVVIYLGARGQTAKQISDVLGLQHKSTSKLHEICAWLWFLINESGARRDELLLANQLFIHADIDIRMDYDQWAEAYYNTIPVSMSFATRPQGSRRRINEWIHKKTDGQLQDLIPDGGISARLLMLSINVAYFRGLWRGAFPHGSTYKAQFQCSPTSLLEVEMMQKEEGLLYGDFPDLRCVVVFLPLSWTQGWMTVILPYKTDSVAELEYRLRFHNFNSLRKRMKKHFVSIHLPKFRLENSLELSRALPVLGIEDLFEAGKTDLSAMLECPPDDLALTDFVHKACIEVGEAGRPTAKPKTKFSCVPKQLTKVAMVVNRPFLFFIQDGISKVIVFSGHVVTPTAAEEDVERLGDAVL